MEPVEQEQRRRFKAVQAAREPHGMWSLCELTTYKGEREDADGRHQDITMRIDSTVSFTSRYLMRGAVSHEVATMTTSTRPRELSDGTIWIGT